MTVVIAIGCARRGGLLHASAVSRGHVSVVHGTGERPCRAGEPCGARNRRGDPAGSCRAGSVRADRSGSQRFPRPGGDHAQMTDDLIPPEPGVAVPRTAGLGGDRPDTPLAGGSGDDDAGPGSAMSVGAGLGGIDPIPVVPVPAGGPGGWRPRPSGALSGPGWDGGSRLYWGSASSPSGPPGYPGHARYPTGGAVAGGAGQYGGSWGGGPVFPPAGAAGSEVVTAVPGHPQLAHRGGWGALLAVATVAVVVAAGFAGGVFGARLTAGTGTAPLAQLSTAVAAAGGPVAAGSVEQVAAVLLPSVVSVLSSSSSGSDEGSGIILTSDGMILTNNSCDQRDAQACRCN